MDLEGEVIGIDGLKSYSAALREVGAIGQKMKGHRLKNRVENSHLPFRRMKTLEKFASVHGSVHNHFNQDHRLNTWQQSKDLRYAVMAE